MAPSIEELQAEAATYRALVDNSTDLIYRTDVAGKITFISAAVHRLSGYTVDEAIGMDMAREVYLSPERRELLLAQLRRHGQVTNFEAQLRRKDGSAWWASTNARLRTDAEGNVLGVEGITRDITALKNAEQALRQMEERFRLAFHTSPDAINLNRLADGTYIDINEGFSQLSGYSREDVVGKTSLEIDIWADPADRERLTAELQASGYVKNLEARFRMKDGTTRTALMSARILRTRDEEHILSITRDITERKHVEAQLHQAQKMESVGRLAGGVAHDFNNMLSIILAHSELALEELDLTEAAQAAFLEIQAAAQRSADLTRQLLAFARKQTATPKVLDLNDAVDRTLRMLRPLIGEDIALSWKPMRGALPVKLDPSQLDQILTNLGVNARDAITGIGEIAVETGLAVLEEGDGGHADLEPGDYVTLTFGDNGCGMDAETLENIFEPFFTSKSVGRGTGLGLATVYGIVKQNGGFINAESKLGRGTRFKIYLPRHAKAEAARESHRGSSLQSSQGSETVLLVEDEPAILRLGQRALERRGYTVLTALGPLAALRLVEEYVGEIHLLVTDVIMPEMNGLELAERLLSLQPAMKRLFMSGYSADVVSQRGVPDVGEQFLRKPFLVRELAAKVRALLDQDPCAGN